MCGLADPAAVDYSEMGTAGFDRQLLGGEGRGVRSLFYLGFEGVEVVELEDVAASHEIYDVPGGAIDGVHADEMRILVEANGIEAIVFSGSHGVECVALFSDGPAFFGGDLFCNGG